MGSVVNQNDRIQKAAKKARQDPKRLIDWTERGTWKLNATMMTSYKAASLTF
jgi:hypothetical protein